MNAKPRMTYEQHEELGQMLKSIADELVKRCVQVENAFPQKSPGGRAAHLLDGASAALRRACTEMQGQLFRDHKEQAEAEDHGLSVYYGGNRLNLKTASSKETP